ncbi:pogo transposable element with KRAB domain isoform X2 [Phyllostomus discolor]|uniref:Pogo transposable element with KRAB domain isoform X2 n=1 Tax=Phyllostomus discolor TaxID=89673 RepID=A0A7E6CXY7_9CHIR|nr:pogo transposable element with KRAB domain isoform X2 [Phyllostomus discolor]
MAVTRPRAPCAPEWTTPLKRQDGQLGVLCYQRREGTIKIGARPLRRGGHLLLRRGVGGADRAAEGAVPGGHEDELRDRAVPGIPVPKARHDLPAGWGGGVSEPGRLAAPGRKLCRTRGSGRQASGLGRPRAHCGPVPATAATAPGRLRAPPAPGHRRPARVGRGVPLLHGRGLPGVRPLGRRPGRQVPVQPGRAPQLRRGLQADGGGVRRGHQQLPGGQAVRRAGEERARLAQGEAAAAERARHAAGLPGPQERPLRPGGPARGRVRALHAGQGGPHHQGGHAAEGPGDRPGDEHPREGLQGQPGLVPPDDAAVRPVAAAQGAGAPAAARGPDREAGHLPAQRAGAAPGARLPGGPDGERGRDAHLPGGAVQGHRGQPGGEARAGEDAGPREAEDHRHAGRPGGRPEAAALHHPEGHVHPAGEVPQRHGDPLPPLRLDDGGPHAGLAGGGVAAAHGRCAQAARHADPERLPGPRHRLGEELHGEHGHRHGHHPGGPDLAAAGAGRGGVQAAQRQRARAVLQLAAGGQPGAQPHGQRQEAAPRPLPGVGHGGVEQHLQRGHRPGLQEVPHLQQAGGGGGRPVGDRGRAAGRRGGAGGGQSREPLSARAAEHMPLCLRRWGGEAHEKTADDPVHRRRPVWTARRP